MDNYFRFEYFKKLKNENDFELSNEYINDFINYFSKLQKSYQVKPLLIQGAPHEFLSLHDGKYNKLYIR
jgi:hypothetical protein